MRENLRCRENYASEITYVFTMRSYFLILIFLHGQCDHETKQIMNVRQCKLAPSAAVIGKNFIGEMCQILTRTKLLTKSCPETYLPGES